MSVAPFAADDHNEHPDIPRPRSRNMMISPNLRAALEFDEQTRASRAPSESSHPPAFRSSRPPSPNRADGPAAGGLPPPPRPKSRASSLHKTKSPPMSPTTPLVGDTPLVPVLHSPQPPPPTPLSPGPSSGYEGMTTAFNPYINPPPLLSHFYAENNAVLAHSRSFSLPTTMAANNNVSIPPPPPSPAPAPPPQASSSPRTSESPRREKPPSSSPIQMSSPESAGGSTGSEGRSSFQRHLRYLSSLQKVEKMLAKGKTRAVGKGGDGRQRVEGERRGSVGASAEQDPCDKMQRERLPGLGVHRRRIRASASERVGRVAGSFSLGASSAPSSPVAYMVDPAVSSGAVAGTRPESRRSVGLLPDSAPVAGVMPRPPLRPLISHGRRASAASTAASSDESHEAPSTPDAARISISSTLYHDSNYSFHDPHLPDAPWTPPGSIHRRNTMDSDRESFIDLASPTFSPRLTDFTSNASMSSDSQLSHHYHHPYATDPHNTDAHIRARAKPSLPAISTLTVKPPLPTSPKPNFGKRSRSAQPPQRSDSLDSPSVQEVTYSRVLPPTTNLLHPHERAEGVRKTRKIAQMFGQTPAAPEALVPSRLSFESTAPNGLMCAPTGLMAAATAAAGGGKHGLKHHRGAVSMSVAQGASDAFPQPLWPPPEADASHYVALSARRHSTPLTPDTFSFMDDELVSPADSRSSDSRHTVLIEVGSQQGTAHSDWSSHLGHRRSAVGPTSPTSFMDLSEEDMLADGVSSIISLETPKGDRRPGLFKSSSSIYSFTSEDLEEEDRRRKRDKLAKLHRFLGSRVPLEVVLGQLSIDAHPQQDLPPVVSPSTVVDTTPPAPPRPMDGDARKAWVRRRRSSSAGELGGKWFDDLDRLKEELNNKEKAQNVKRAVKMEKMFGVAPPQTLYHTRSAAPPSGSAGPSSSSVPQFVTTPSSPTSPTSRNVNQSSYYRNKAKRDTRPGTADSTEPLISSHGNGRISGAHGFSDVYEHYRHSLNSLNDILDRDDKESLQHLHGIIHGETDVSLQPFTRQDSPSPSPPPTPKAERRRSLPTRSSMTSLASEFSISTIVTTTPPEEKMFQTRRRRAAKLTQFFGVDYKDLVNEVFESLESGLREESGRGTLKPDEVQELLNKLRKLKTKRNSLFT